jgi:CRP-like cAMP-binding protein
MLSRSNLWKIKILIKMRGEIFGEIALLTEMRRRRATITAKTPTVALTLTRPDFEVLVDVYPDFHEELTVASDELMNKRLKALMAAKVLLDQQA